MSGNGKKELTMSDKIRRNGQNRKSAHGSAKKYGRRKEN